MSSSFDLHTEQGKWRKWDKFFERVLELIKANDKEEGDSADLSSKSALEIGCGTGWSAQALAKHCARVVAVDADASLVARANQASAFSPNGKKISFLVAEDLAKFDAFGEKFDIVFSGYTLAYLGEVIPVLRHWASLLKPGGLLIVLEIQGLMSVHSPLGTSKVFFNKFDKETLKQLGYTSNAGTQMGDALQSLSELELIAYEDWSDAELSFEGPLEPGSPVFQGWEDRWKRLWPLMTSSGPVDGGLHEAFFSCLTSPEHTCEKAVKLLICRYVGSAPVRLSIDHTEGETSAAVDTIAYGSGGPEGGDD